VPVFHHEVLIEKANGLFAGGGGEADEVGVEVFEHLAPEIIDGTVALVGDDEVVLLNGETWVVFDVELLRLRRALSPAPLPHAGEGFQGGGGFKTGDFVQVFSQLLTAQHGVKRAGWWRR